MQPRFEPHQIGAEQAGVCFVQRELGQFGLEPAKSKAALVGTWFVQRNIEANVLQPRFEPTQLGAGMNGISYVLCRVWDKFPATEV